MSLLHEPIAAVCADSGTTLRSLPILILNVHSHCNCRCVMCDIWKRTNHEQIDAADLERHRESLKKLGVRHVVLSGGEPLLHTDLTTICRFFRELDIKLTLLTTGLLLVKRAHEVAENFDEVIVSIDGPAEVHDAVRRVAGAFALIRKGIEAVRALCPGLRITRQAGFDAISFLAADLTSEAFNRSLVWPGERQNQIALTPNEISVLETEIDALLRLNEEFDTTFVTESRGKLERIVRHFRAHLGLASPQAPICNAPWVSAVIETDGSLRPCFFHRPVGNVRTSVLDEVVNGEEARIFRQTLEVERNPICQRCVCSLNHPQGPHCTPAG
jgi:Fe-coproporphyrin III synthase